MSVGVIAGVPNIAARATRSAGGQVFLHQRRRERQHVADVVEAVAGVVLREIVSRTQLDAQQIPNRVVVFLAVQPPRGHAAGIRRGDAGRSARARARARPRPPGADAPPAAARRPAAFRDAQLQHDVVPALAMLDQRLDRCQRLEVQIASCASRCRGRGRSCREEGLDGALESVGRRGVQDRGRPGRRRRASGPVERGPTPPIHDRIARAARNARMDPPIIAQFGRIGIALISRPSLHGLLHALHGRNTGGFHAKPRARRRFCFVFWHSRRRRALKRSRGRSPGSSRIRAAASSRRDGHFHAGGNGPHGNRCHRPRRAGTRRSRCRSAPIGSKPR